MVLNNCLKQKEFLDFEKSILNLYLMYNLPENNEDKNKKLIYFVQQEGKNIRKTFCEAFCRNYHNCLIAKKLA